MLTLKLDRQVISSSPPEQSCIPSQVCSFGINLSERLQKKYLLSISFLTVRKMKRMVRKTSKTEVRIFPCSLLSIYISFTEKMEKLSGIGTY